MRRDECQVGVEREVRVTDIRLASFGNGWARKGEEGVREDCF